MKKIQKLLAIVLTVAMVLAMSVSAFATTVTKPTDQDKKDFTVSSLNAGDEVYLYKVIGAKYDQYGFEKYVWCADFAKDDQLTGKDVVFDKDANDNTFVVGMTSNNITAYADTVEYKDATITKKVDTGAKSVTFEGLEVGTYVVLVKANDSSTVYNPMVGSIYYTKGGSDNEMQEGAVSAADWWGLETTNAYVKSSEPTITKTTSEPAENQATSGNDKGNDVGYGETIQYDVKTTIPSYSEEYRISLTEDVTLSDGSTGKKCVLMYQVEDTLDASLDLVPETIKVTVAGTDTYEFDGKNVTLPQGSTATSADNITIETTAHGYVVTLDGGYAIDKSTKPVEITYNAVLNGSATNNYDANENTVKLKYGHNPKDKDDTKEKFDKTYHYTFAIDGGIVGNEKWSDKTEWSEQDITHEFIKVGPNKVEVMDPIEGDSKYYESKINTTTTDTEGLQGAEFTLYTDADCKVSLERPVYNADGSVKKDENGAVVTEIVTRTTDANGYLFIDGLDAGNYWMKETKAPEGYTLNTHVVPVVITATYDKDTGTLTAYEVNIDGIGNKYEATYGTIDKGTTVNVLPKEVTHFWTVDGKPHTTFAEAKAKAEELVASTYFFKNTKLSGLPSTGGVGTTIFTVTGVALMILAAAMLLVVRRAKEQA